MKTRAFLFTILLLITTTIVFANETIRGNKNIVTKTVSISDYNEISMAGQMEFVYEQSNAAPYFEITIDENVFPYVNIEVKGKHLIVGPKQENNRNSYNLQPTVYKIKTNSKELKEVNKAGSGKFLVTSPLQTKALNISSAGSGSIVFSKNITCDDIKISMAGSGSILSQAPLALNQAEINMAGSGSVKLQDRLTAKDLKLSMAGSGHLAANNIAVTTASCNLSSSGEINVSGEAKNMSYSLAGSGKIKAYDCIANDVKSSISGSGKIELYAKDQLNASIMGSGNIFHKGTASVQSSKSGSGSVKHIN